MDLNLARIVSGLLSSIKVDSDRDKSKESQVLDVWPNITDEGRMEIEAIITAVQRGFQQNYSHINVYEDASPRRSSN